MKPARFTHDCLGEDGCIYLGQHNEWDLYFCPNCDGGTCLARYGDEGHQYSSFPVASLESPTNGLLRFYNHDGSHKLVECYYRWKEREAAK